MSPSPRPITIRDVAREAGVSVTATSRALNGKGEISPEKRAAVLAAVEKLQFTPSAAARVLVSGQANTIGVLVSNNASPVFAQVLQGAEEVAIREGFGLLFADSADSQEQALRALAHFRANRVGGLLLTPVQTDRRDVQALDESETPFVLLLRYFAARDDDAVTLDNRLAGFEVTVHLLERGHRCIGHVAGPMLVSSARDRLAGYRRALKQHWVPFRPDWVVAAPFTIEGGRAAAHQLLDRVPNATAIFAATDLQAVGVLKATRERGLRVPRDLALAGGDDIELAEYLSVPLTTFRQPARQIGARAAERLIVRIRGDRTPPERLILKPTLVIRESSG